MLHSLYLSQCLLKLPTRFAALFSYTNPTTRDGQYVTYGPHSNFDTPQPTTTSTARTVARRLPCQTLGKALCCTRLAAKVNVHTAIGEGSRPHRRTAGHASRCWALLGVQWQRRGLANKPRHQQCHSRRRCQQGRQDCPRGDQAFLHHLVLVGTKVGSSGFCSSARARRRRKRGTKGRGPLRRLWPEALGPVGSVCRSVWRGV